MKSIDELINEYYSKFVGLPTNKPIVRQNQVDDAFEIVVLEILYGKELVKELGIDISKMSASNISELSKMIVAPPDEGIDIIIEREEIDGNSYDFIQVKNYELSQLDIQQAISYMEKTVTRYLEKPSDTNANLREVLSETSFSKSDKSNCRYIVVHRGNTNYFKAQKENKEIVITGTELEIIRESNIKKVPRVSKETFGSDTFNNFIMYEEAQDNPAILMNICGYDLARLALKYTNTSLGRNILFGQNLREGLSKSKTFDGMAKTIREEPEKFWFYNNGITVIAENYDTKYEYDSSGEKKIERLTLKDFSIINGAQTTSALGRFLKEADMNRDQEDIDKLKKVFVLARILKVTDDDFKSQIAIFNNTQNPITTRDMAANREEQLQLYSGLIEGSTPNIYMEIRRGGTSPSDIHLYKHQYTTNLELAQLAFAGFFRDPFTAKDKKNAIFDTDYKQTEYLLNKYYHKLFHYASGDESEGILFKKSKDEINELLFVHFLYKEAKKLLLSEYKKRINDTKIQLDHCDDDYQRKKLETKIGDYEKLKAIANICVFYCISYYYGFKDEFYDADKGLLYKYDEFYSLDKDFRKKMTEGFRDLFLTETIVIIRELTVNYPNLNTWIRDKKSTQSFLEKADDRLQVDMTLKSRYEQYIHDFKK